MYFLIFIFLLVLAICWYKYVYAPYQLFKRMNVPHPPVTPFFGNALQILKEESTVIAIEKWIKKYGKIMEYYVGPSPITVIADLDMIKEITVKQFDKFTDSQKEPVFSIQLRKKINCGAGLLFELGTEWKRIRHIVSPTFSSKKLKMMTSSVEKSCISLIERLDEINSSGNSADIHKLFGQFTMESMLAVAFGSQVDIIKGEGNSLTEAAKGLFADLNNSALIWSNLLSSHFPGPVKILLHFFGKKFSIFKNYEYLSQTSQDIIQSRRQQMEQQTGPRTVRNDFLQLLLEARAEDDNDTSLKKTLTDEEITGLCIDFLLAGYETTSTLLAFTSYLLAMNSDKQDLLCEAIDEYYQENEDTATLYDASQNIPYLDWVIQESLRIYPPASVTSRTCTETCTINGITFYKGNVVDFPLQYNLHSSEYWDQPEIFEPKRFSPEGKEGRNPMCHLPFGWGPRACIGMRFALMEAKMALVNILKKFKFERSQDTQVPLKLRQGITQVPRDGVFLKVVKRY